MRLARAVSATLLADEWHRPDQRICIGYARRWRCRRMIAVNRFAVRGADPAVVFAAATLDPVGPLNDAAIARAAAVVTAACGIVVAAWGAFGANTAQRRVCRRRGEAVIELLDGAELHVLGLTLDGHPCHPLYLSADACPERWRLESDNEPRRSPFSS